MPPTSRARSSAQSGDLAAFASIAGEERITSLLIGSGLEPDGATADLVRTGTALSRPTVLDGGGLTVLAGNSRLIEGRPDIVLTPHEGEFGRLFPDLVARASKVERAREAARRTGCTIVLKGSDTVVAAPDGGSVVSAGAPPTLATAGSGDVLAGIITGLLGLQMPPFQAAAMGVWLHGRGGGRLRPRPDRRRPAGPASGRPGQGAGAKGLIPKPLNSSLRPSGIRPFSLCRRRAWDTSAPDNAGRQPAMAP